MEEWKQQYSAKEAASAAIAISELLVASLMELLRERLQLSRADETRVFERAREEAADLPIGEDPARELIFRALESDASGRSGSRTTLLSQSVRLRSASRMA